jgi:hypothetical protein
MRHPRRRQATRRGYAMTAGALSRNLLCALLVAAATIAQAAVVGPDSPSIAPRQIVATGAPAASAAPPLIDATQARAARSAISIPLPPALMLLGTALASLLGLRGLRRRS